MDEIEVARLRRSFRAIRDGYSLTSVLGEKIYIKHLSSLERGDIDDEHVGFFDAAVKKGLSGEKERLIYLAKEKVWTEKDEGSIVDAHAYVKNLIDTKANVLPWQLDAINAQIASANKILEGKVAMRSSILGLTAEEFARRKLDELYICYSMFRNKNFEDLLVSREDMNDYDDENLTMLVRIYNKSMLEVNEETIKKIAVSRFFQDLYSLCDKDAYKFFGKPISDLTYYQCDLAIYGRFFNFILGEETKPPADIADDPNKIIEWHQSTKNAKKELEKTVKTFSDGGSQQAQSLMGATEEDYKKMGMDTSANGPSLASLAKKNGGKLNREQMMHALFSQKV